MEMFVAIDAGKQLQDLERSPARLRLEATPSKCFSTAYDMYIHSHLLVVYRNIFLSVNCDHLRFLILFQ